MKPEESTFAPIGWLRADFKQKFCTPRQGSLAKNSRASVELAPDWKGRGLFCGLEGFSHVWILSHLHLSTVKRQFGKVCPPRLRGEKVGVIGSRSPHRPNNIGLTLAKIISCEKDDLILSEVDLVDGTPILDLKPYLASADRPAEYHCGWADRAESLARVCDFSKEAETALSNLVESGHVSEKDRLRALILEMLTQDPRPPAYLGRENERFAVWVAGLNVIFRFRNEKFVVTDVQWEPNDPTKK